MKIVKILAVAAIAASAFTLGACAHKSTTSANTATVGYSKNH